MLKTEREIIYTPTPPTEGNAVANVFLLLLVLALIAFLGYYVAVMVPSASGPSSSTAIQRTTERQVVVPVPNNSAAPLTTTPTPAPLDNTAPANTTAPAPDNSNTQ